MKPVKSKVLPAVCLALAATPAAAADAIVYDPIPTPSPAPIAPSSDHWSGFYVGVSGGYSWGNVDAGVTATGTKTTTFSPCPIGFVGVCKGGSTRTTTFPIFNETLDFDDNGWLLGGQIGYNARFGNFVAGVEADISYIGADSTATLPMSNNSTIGVGSDYIGTLRGRIGYAFDRVLLYGTAGAAYTDIDLTYNVSVTGTTQSASFSENVWGWTAGVGGEVMVTDRISVKTEYLYADFGDVDFTFDNGLGVASSGNVDLSRHIFRVGLNYHF